MRDAMGGGLFFLLAFASSSFSLSGSLRPSSQVSRAALGLLRYDELERAQRGHREVLVSSCFSPLRRELPVVREMRRVSVWRRGARQEAASLFDAATVG